jgi:sterol 14-demethylase
MRIRVDRDLCQGHGVCRTEAPEVFDVDRDLQQVVVKDERPPEALREKVRTAVRFCPTRALSIEEE